MDVHALWVDILDLRHTIEECEVVWPRGIKESRNVTSTSTNSHRGRDNRLRVGFFRAFAN
jgi:hypothetical protein